MFGAVIEHYLCITGAIGKGAGRYPATCGRLPRRVSPGGACGPNTRWSRSRRKIVVLRRSFDSGALLREFHSRVL
ncbi:MAG: hypothetical protein D6760_07185 [Deltaproteobacteria bacterium]|nr:MAG: hypothetical protein D6760_07185 [Deltaproteobacteria bacterium]